MRMTRGLAEPMLDAFKAELDGSFGYVFSGPLPAGAGDALDMVNDHTLLSILTESGDGTTGLTFDVPDDHSIAKNPSESWRGLISFSGAQAAESSLAPTFIRWCPPGDDGQGAADTPRLQCTAGGPNSTAVARLASDTLTDNGTAETGLAGFTYSLVPLQ
ncbi:hypothetical protein [Luteimonas saliphila]|uniref:hypothetical protein n=1 Tax=Luteimonas saliphila TaxID=2804919 RepID=UPI00192DF41C|nr:hypothetical protein [Luteimonas saliphila]